MAWDDKPPSEEELKPAKNAKSSWDSAPPTAQELGQDKWAQYAGAIGNQADKIKEFNPNAALQGGANVATSGYLPQAQAIAGGLVNLVSNPTKDVDESLKSQGFNVQEQPDTYVSRRDQAVKEQQRLAQQNPGSYLAGGVGGAILSAPGYGKLLGLIPGLGATSKTGALALGANVAKAGAGGAIQGAIQNPGDVEGQIDPIQAKERLQNAVTGAELGSAAQGVGAVLGKGAQVIANAGSSLQSSARATALKSSGAMLKDYRRIIGKGRVDELGQSMIDNGLVEPGMSFHDVADKSGQIKQEVGQKIGAVYDNVRANVSKDPSILNKELSIVNPDIMQQEMSDILKDPKIRPKMKTGSYDEQMASRVSDILGSGRAAEMVDAEIKNNPQILGLSKSNPEQFKAVRDSLIKQTQHANLADPRNLNDLIGEIDKDIRWAKSTPDLSNQENGLVALRRYLRDKVNAVSDVTPMALIGDQKTSDLLKQHNKLYSQMTEINNISKDRVAREKAKDMFGLTSTIAGIGGAGAGAIIGGEHGGLKGAAEGALTGAALGLLHKGAKHYGNPILTTGASKVGGFLSKLPIQGPMNALSNIKNIPLQVGPSAERLRAARP